MGFVLPREVEGDRLRLTCWSVELVHVLADLVARNVEHLRPWMPWVIQEPMTTDARVELIAGWETARRAGGDGIYAMVTADAVVGSCGLHHRLGAGGLEIGYWVDVDRLRRGYATAAAKMLSDVAFTFAEIDRVEIHHDAANVRSSAVPRRLGYERVAVRDRPIEAPGECGVEWVWRVTREQWVLRDQSAYRDG